VLLPRVLDVLVAQHRACAIRFAASPARSYVKQQHPPREDLRGTDRPQSFSRQRAASRRPAFAAILQPLRADAVSKANPATRKTPKAGSRYS
jgi:hypothetical protein